MKVTYITNAPKRGGIGHRAYYIRKDLELFEDIELRGVSFPNDSLPFTPWPGVLGSKTINWIRWGRSLKPDTADVYHITNQTLSFIAKKLSPAIITVHDIIEILEPQEKLAYLLNKYLYSGIPKAKHIISVSEYTKQTLIDTYDIPAKRITVIPNGVSPAFYHLDDIHNTIGYQEIRGELKLADAHPVVLYVGSDHPRKNLPSALKAFAKLKMKRPDALFVKVGDPGLRSGRQTTLEVIDELGIKGSVRFVGSIPDEKLNLLYNCADVLIFPSRFEGFGLPPLQAMAAGTPVVCSNTTSLPEVVGDAAITCDPYDIDGLVQGLSRITEDKVLAKEYTRRGIARAKTFTWKKAAAAVKDVYAKAI